MPRPAERAARSLVMPAIFFIVSILSISVSLVAAGSGLGVIALPFEMHELAQRTPYVFRAHMLSAAMALLFAPAVILLRHKPELHRPLGRLLGVFVVIGGLTALPVALVSHSSVAARVGFFVQGLVWMALLGAAWRAVLERHVVRHVQFMLAMVAVTTGAVWFRLFIGTAIVLRLPFEPAYALAAWAGWMIPLAAVTYFRGALAKALLSQRQAAALAHSVRLV